MGVENRTRFAIRLTHKATGKTTWVGTVSWGRGKWTTGDSAHTAHLWDCEEVVSKPVDPNNPKLGKVSVRQRDEDEWKSLMKTARYIARSNEGARVEVVKVLVKHEFEVTWPLNTAHEKLAALAPPPGKLPPLDLLLEHNKKCEDAAKKGEQPPAPPVQLVQAMGVA